MKRFVDHLDAEDYREILKEANIKERAMLLLAANCAMYPQDICDLEKEHLNLKKKTLVMFQRLKLFLTWLTGS